jgi:hypothetical protein
MTMKRIEGLLARSLPGIVEVAAYPDLRKPLQSESARPNYGDRINRCFAYGFVTRAARLSVVLGFLSGCAVQICGNEFPYRTNSCPIDSLAPLMKENSRSSFVTSANAYD